jgi:hypothetical protein
LWEVLKDDKTGKKSRFVETVRDGADGAEADMANDLGADLHDRDLPVLASVRNSGRQAVGRDVSGAASMKTEHSAKPVKLAPAEHSGNRTRRQAPKTQPAENKNNVFQLSAQRGAVYEKSKWKRSRKKPGYLIRRMTGYSIAETEYGVSYLWVVSRKPDRTTADNSVHPLAGYFNWKALEASGLFCKERKYDKRDKTAIAG